MVSVALQHITQTVMSQHTALEERVMTALEQHTHSTGEQLAHLADRCSILQQSSEQMQQTLAQQHATQLALHQDYSEALQGLQLRLQQHEEALQKVSSRRNRARPPGTTKPLP